MRDVLHRMVNGKKHLLSITTENLNEGIDLVQSNISYTLTDNVELYRVRRFTRHLLSTTPLYHNKSMDRGCVTRQNRA